MFISDQTNISDEKLYTCVDQETLLYTQGMNELAKWNMQKLFYKRLVLHRKN